MSYGYGGYPPQGGAPPPAPGGYPPAPGGAGYPPLQGGAGYPPPQGGAGYPPPQGGAGYPPVGGSGYPPQQGGVGYPPPGGGTGYPPQQQGYGAGYPPSQGGQGYPPTGAPGYAPAPGGYPPTGGGGLGFDNMSSGPPQPPAQSYGAMPPAQGYYPQPGGYGQPAGYPAQSHQSSAPPASYQPPMGYGAPPPSHHGSSAGKLAAGMAAMKISTHGTVKDYSPFRAEEDAKVLRKAMKGFGTDEKAIINVLGHRSNKQRQEILVSYKQAFGKDLIKDLKSELSGDFESLVKALMMKPRHYDLYCLERAMSGAGTNEAALIEILSSRTNAEIREIKEIYKKEKNKNLEKEIKSETSGHFSRLLVSLTNASREETTTVDAGKARADAQALYQAGEKKWGTDESVFNMIMCTRSHPQLCATFAEYHKVANRDIVKSIESEFSGDIESGLKAVVGVARNAPAYFASRLHKAMHGAGTDDHSLIRLVVSRSEVDMVEIKQEFQKMYGKPLSSYIQGETSGDYKSLLLALVG